MAFTGLALITTVIVLRRVTAKEYLRYTSVLDKKEYPLKKFLHVGLYIMDRLGYKYNSRYDRILLTKVAKVNGGRDVVFYLKIHWGEKILIFLLGLSIVILTGAITGIDFTYTVFASLFLGGIIMLHDKELEKRIKKRKLSIQLDFPNFLNKLALMVNAGLTVRRSWEKIGEENLKDSDFYREVESVVKEIKSGKSELKAYEDFARRCRTVEVARFVTILLQNIRKGDGELVSILRVLSNESWEMRKNTARKLGEEASTKMIIPLTLMFIAMLIILATPAILAIF